MRNGVVSRRSLDDVLKVESEPAAVSPRRERSRNGREGRDGLGCQPVVVRHNQERPAPPPHIVLIALLGPVAEFSTFGYAGFVPEKLNTVAVRLAAVSFAIALSDEQWSGRDLFDRRRAARRR